MMKLAFIGSPERYRGKFGEYRKWSLWDSYGYTLLFSPEILHCFRTLPELLNSTAIGSVEFGKYDLIVLPECKDSSPTEGHLCKSKAQKAIVVQPSEKMLYDRCNIDSVKKVPSLKETWHMPEKDYLYPSGLEFQILVPKNAEVLSLIGENPDCFLCGNTGVFTTDFFKAITAHIHEPILPRLLSDASKLLCKTVLSLAGITPTPCSTEDEDLHRDFHAAGYALQIMRELCGDNDFLPTFEHHLIAASDAFVSSQFDLCQSRLKDAFTVLADYRKRIISKDIFFIDTIHAGSMLSDSGYFEFDWPQKTAEFLSNMTSWVERRNFKFCVDFGAGAMEHFFKRYPKLKARMAKAAQAGLIEFVNGTYSQPYPLLYSNESMLRQFEFGKTEVKSLFGVEVKTYASQEFGFTSSLPALLNLAGYHANVGRVYNQGDVPRDDKKLINWRGKDGEEIPTLPAHSYPSEKEYDFTYANLHIKLQEAEKHAPDIVVSTSLGDASYYRPFREELTRIQFYAPVFGEICTFADYFKRCQPESTYDIKADDLKFDGYFLNLDNWESLHAKHAGGANRHGCLVQQAEFSLLALEQADATLFALTGTPSGSVNWKPLLQYEGHDNYVVPYETVGEFMRDQGNLIHYCGPANQISLRERSESKLLSSLESAERALDSRLDQLCNLLSGDPDTDLVFNPAPARTILVEVKEKGEFAYLDGVPIPSQPTESGTLLELNLPANGFRLFKQIRRPEQRIVFDTRSEESGSEVICHPEHEDFFERKIPPGNVCKTFPCEGSRLDDWPINNDFFTLKINTSTGILEVLDPSGQPIVKIGLSYKDYFMRTDHVELSESGALRQTVSVSGKLIKSGHTAAAFTTDIELTAHSGILRFKTTLELNETLHGDAWENSIKAAFSFASPVRSVLRNCSGIVEETKLEKFGSLYFTAVRTERGMVNLYNHGNKLYRFRNQTLENVLLTEREPMRTFEYALELNAPATAAQALKAVSPCFIKKANPSVQNKPVQPAEVFSLFTHDAENVLVTGMREQNGQIEVTYQEVAGKETTVTVRSPLPIKRAYFTDLSGNIIEELPLKSGGVTLKLNPCALKIVRFLFS